MSADEVCDNIKALRHHDGRLSLLFIFTLTSIHQTLRQARLVNAFKH